MTALAAAIVAAATAGSGAALRGARRDAVATALALARLDTLRAGPCDTGTDATPGDGVDYAEAWRCTSGRGRPDPIDVTVTWPGHQLSLETEVLR